MSVSGLIDESPYTSPGTHLQSQQDGMEMKNNRILDQFKKMKMKINEWERSIENRSVLSVEIHQQLNLLSKVINDLSN